ncbi:hypothetical protein HMPREF1320_2103 [Capnocytophaga sp. oral taxon 335 str. F0486]|nr:hypothetical protein HMPREF1320_2103 [Capnocytophaga sp. oral taxon 335 str. F0486]
MRFLDQRQEIFLKKKYFRCKESVAYATEILQIKQIGSKLPESLELTYTS